MYSSLNISSDLECEVIISGKSYGKTPKKVVVKAGYVVVILRHPELGDIIKEVQIIDGDTQSIYHQFR